MSLSFAVLASSPSVSFIFGSGGVVSLLALPSFLRCCCLSHVILGDKLTQLRELHTLARTAMEGIFQLLRPGEATPSNPFDLVVRLQGAPLWIGSWKASACMFDMNYNSHKLDVDVAVS